MLTSDEIIWGYRYMLDRDPRPEEMLRLALDPITRTQLRARLQGSDEFAAHEKTIGHVSKWVITEIFDGNMKIWIDLADKYVSFGCLIDNYEPQETAAFRRLLRPGFHVADVGANVGWFTFLAALCTGPEDRVTAIEPRVPTVDYLRRSVRLNQLEDRITVLQNAVGNRAGTVSLTWQPASRNPGSTHLGEPKENDEGQMAEMRELDALLGGARVDFIKMDIEGAEGLALIGASAILQENRPFILCEINPAALRAVSDMSVEEFLRTVGAQGYIPFLLEDCATLARLEGPPEFGGRELINIVLAHRERLPDSAPS
jgi:FkbM family methyltransferase